jgi:diguanylate cyclase (GGDEF)-like protein
MDQTTILVVDDELFFRQLYRDLLQDTGAQVEVYDNGDDAINRLAKGGVDLVLTDMVMPGRCGLEVLRAARALVDPPEVILVTGHASLESAIHALKNGARDYLVKPFNPEELKHLVKNCFDQRRLLYENEQLRQQLQLFQTGQSLASIIELERLFMRAIEVFMREFDGGFGLAFLVDDEKGLILQGHQNVSPEQSLQLAAKISPLIKSATGFIRLDPDKISSPAAQDVESLCALPLFVEKVFRGGLVLGNGHRQDILSLPPKEQDRLHYLSEQLVLGFENACRYQNAQDLMYSDDLTGLYNYRYLQIALNQEARRSQRYGLKFSLVFIDLDRFKGINDRHGHLAGSAALQEVAQLLRSCVREVDTLFRFGGDEFAALLVETGSDAARVVAERIRKSVAEHAFLAERGKDCYLTATAGYATFPSDALDTTELLELADRAMYDGKLVRNAIRGVKEIKSSPR